MYGGVGTAVWLEQVPVIRRRAVALSIAENALVELYVALALALAHPRWCGFVRKPKGKQVMGEEVEGDAVACGNA